MNIILSLSFVLLASSLCGLGLLEYSRQQSNNHILSMKSRFSEYQSQYNLSFKTQQEEDYRLYVFLDNIQEIEDHNSSNKDSHVAGVNKFTHLTTEEFTAKYLNRPEKPHRKSGINKSISNNKTILRSEKKHPLSIDWRKKGAVTEVRDQGNCGCCYAITSTGALEGLYFIKTKSLKQFSPQYIIDCSNKQYDNKGCNGGFSQGVFEFVKHNGINLESEYPYEEKLNKKCKENNKAIKFVNGYVEIPKGDCEEMERVLSQQPVSVSIDATILKNYSSGILKQCKKKVNLNHEVLAVGYTPEYFIIKNSWGTNWGLDGYFHVSKDNNCGTCDDSSYPTL